MIERIDVVDSHTGGEPTRVIVKGGPSLHGSLAERLRQLRTYHDHFRSASVNEPRGSDVMVGALLLPPDDPQCATAVVFFNNVGYLGMCGHGAMGVMVTLAHLGRVPPGLHRIETPVGVVSTHLHDANSVSVRNVPSFRLHTNVRVDVEGHGPVHGDVAWGGNWFFLVSDHGQPLELSEAPRLTDFCWRIRRALARAGVTGAGRAEVDHVELFSPSPREGLDSRNFVLCPGGAYDRSPCGTGTSAKLACLRADGKLRAGEIWRQESITGSVFEGSFTMEGPNLLPTIRGTAWVNGEGTLLADESDPLRWGIRE